MDKDMMMLWIDSVLVPWKKSVPEGIVPLLILDSFHVHMMATIVQQIQEIGIKVQHIPGGCTYLCQPINIGVNRLIKRKLAEQWEDWMDVKGALVGRDVITPSREVIANWVVDAYWLLTKKTCQNAWKKKGFEWVVDN